MPLVHSYIIAARRTALGRVGGLHRARRVEALAAPVIGAALADAGLDPAQVQEILVGNCTAGDNPARLIALTAGLPDACVATTIDQQCASGLEAVLAAVRRIACAEAEIIVAGGVEAISTAPWRIARPRALHQVPHFIVPEGGFAGQYADPDLLEALEALAARLGLSRTIQDDWALRSHSRAARAAQNRRFAAEIVRLKGSVEEGRDQSAIEPTEEDLADMLPFAGPQGTLTPGNTSALHDGAAFVVVVSETVWRALGCPRAVRLVGSASLGVGPGAESLAPVHAMRKLLARLDGIDRRAIGVVELCEAAAGQAIALEQELDIDDALVNPDGGAVVRGSPLGAAGAVTAVRLFSTLVRQPPTDDIRFGAATLGARGGMGVAALLERV